MSRFIIIVLPFTSQDIFDSLLILDVFPCTPFFFGKHVMPSGPTKLDTGSCDSKVSYTNLPPGKLDGTRNEKSLNICFVCGCQTAVMWCEKKVCICMYKYVNV